MNGAFSYMVSKRRFSGVPSSGMSLAPRHHMKQTFKTVGTVTLDRNDLMQVIKDYLQRNNKLTTRKMNFTEDGLVEAQVESEGLPGMTVSNLPHKKGAKLNKGLFPMLREYFKSEMKRQKTNLKFSDLWELVHVQFPNMTEEKMRIYLHDKRQLPAISYDKNKELIYLKHGAY